MDRFVGLSVFVSAVERGSLAAASRHLGMTPSMAGKHLAALETSLGVRLLHRTTRRLHLTEAGRDYCQRARNILESLEIADHAARRLQEEPRGHLRITAPTSFGALCLGQPVADYTRRHPGVTVDLSLEDRFVDLVSGGFDLAIRIGDMPDSTLIARSLARVDMVVCAAPSYLDEKGRPSSPADLQHLDLLAFNQATSAGDWQFTDRRGNTRKAEGAIKLVADNMQILQAAAAAGAGIAFGPRFVFQPCLAAGSLEQVLTRYTTKSLDIRAVYPSARMVGVKVRAFIDQLEQWFAQQQTM